MTQAPTTVQAPMTTPPMQSKTHCGGDSPYAFFNVGATYAGRSSDLTIVGWNDPQPHTPSIMPDYCMSDGIAPDILSWFTVIGKEPLYITGPTGCGKTTGLKQVVARCNWPVYEVTGHARMEMPDLVGHLTMRGGTMYYEYGPLALAMRYGGVFLFNEIDLCDPSLLAALNTVLDGSPLCIAENGGEVIVPHELFRFVATANSAGCGDDSGLYQGVLRQNLAFMDRFLVLKASYLPDDVEREVIQKAAPGLPEDAITKYVEFANAVRAAFTGSGESNMSLSVTMSTRTIVRWAKLSAIFTPLTKQGVNVAYYALERALINRADESTTDSLREIFQRIFGSVPDKN